MHVCFEIDKYSEWIYKYMFEKTFNVPYTRKLTAENKLPRIRRYNIV